MVQKNKSIPKFYVASQSIRNELLVHNGDGYVKYTEKEAIEAAKTKLRETNQEQYVVKIVRRVCRKPMPIVVEAVK